jgi:hypothetical protein
MSKRVQTIGDLLQYGLHHQSAGRLNEAEAAYRRLLAAAPHHPDALHLLGMVAFASRHVGCSLGGCNGQAGLAAQPI